MCRNNAFEETRGPAKQIGFRLGKDAEDITVDGTTAEGFTTVHDKRKSRVDPGAGPEQTALSPKRDKTVASSSK